MAERPIYAGRWWEVTLYLRTASMMLDRRFWRPHVWTWDGLRYASVGPFVVSVPERQRGR